MRWALCLGLTACFSLGCPGAEPSATGSGGAGAGGAPSGTSTSSSSSGKGGEGEGGSDVSSTSGTGGNNEGGCGADILNDPANCGACDRACVKDERVDKAECVDGLCTSSCKSGFVNRTTPAAGPDNGCETPGRRVFVTSASFSVTQLGGLSGADGHCQDLADAENLGGTWRAWLSGIDTQSSPSERFQKLPAAPYMLLDFTPVADNWADLTNAAIEPQLDHAIDLTENMSPVAGSLLVWTGTMPSGQPTGNHCGAWSNAQEGQGTIGDCSQVTDSWTRTAGGTPAPCGGQARLYCFEQ